MKRITKTDNQNLEVSVKEAREALGRSANNLTDDQVIDLVAKFQHIAIGWIESYERSIFEGKTLNDILTPQEEEGLS